MGFEEEKRRTQPPQGDPQLVDAFGIAGFQNRSEIPRHVDGRRPDHLRERPVDRIRRIEFRPGRPDGGRGGAEEQVRSCRRLGARPDREATLRQQVARARQHVPHGPAQQFQLQFGDRRLTSARRDAARVQRRLDPRGARPDLLFRALDIGEEGGVQHIGPRDLEIADGSLGGELIEPWRLIVAGRGRQG